MKRLLLLPLCLAFSGIGYAGDDRSALTLLQAEAGTAVPIVKNPVPSRVSMPSQNIYWPVSWQERCTEGGMEFQYAGHRYSARFGFARGYFDNSINNYRTSPGIIFVDLTNPDDMRYWNYSSLAEIEHKGVTHILSDKNPLTIKYKGGFLSFHDGSGAVIQTFGYGDLLSAWAKYAEKYARTDLGPNPVYLVPQTYWEAATGWHHGYVVNERTPYNPANGLPLDFVELLKGLPPYEVLPSGHSLSLGLSFKPRPLTSWGGLSWDITQQGGQETPAALAGKRKEIIASLTSSPHNFHKKGGSPGGACWVGNFQLAGDNLQANIKCSSNDWNHTVPVALAGNRLKFTYEYYGCWGAPDLSGWPCTSQVSIDAEIFATSPLRLKGKENWLDTFGSFGRESYEVEWTFDR